MSDDDDGAFKLVLRKALEEALAARAANRAPFETEPEPSREEIMHSIIVRVTGMACRRRGIRRCATVACRRSGRCLKIIRLHREIGPPTSQAGDAESPA